MSANEMHIDVPEGAEVWVTVTRGDVEEMHKINMPVTELKVINPE